MPIIDKREAAYWQNRFRLLEEAKKKSADIYVDQIKRQYSLAIDIIQEKIQTFVARYAKNEMITVAQAQELLTDIELQRFKMSLEEYIRLGRENAINYSEDIARELERASIRYRVTRLEALELELKAQVASVYGLTDELTYEMLAQLYRDQYSRTAFEIFKGTGILDTTFALPNFDEIENLIRTPWSIDGQTFSAHIWKNQTQFCQNLVDSLFEMMVLGEGYDIASKKLQKLYGGMLSDCERVVYTEAAYFQGLAQNKCYQRLGVKRYQFLCELNLKTCHRCQNLDLKVFKMSERRVGVNAIPMHPRCRCVEVPYINDANLPGYIAERRSARNQIDKSILVPFDMTYKEWWNKYGKQLNEFKNR